MQVVLVVFKANGQRRSFPLTKDVTVVGRREDSDLRIPLVDVSRKHCRFVKDGEVLRIEDMGSSNGTFHNGQRIQEAVVQPGDTIQVGPAVFTIQIDGVPADDEIRPPPLAIPQETISSRPASQPVSAAAGDFDPLTALQNDDEEAPSPPADFDAEESGQEQGK